MKQGPGRLCQPCYCRTIVSLHLKWNKVSTVTISSQLPRESLYPRKLVGSCFWFVFAGVVFTPGELLQVKPSCIPQQHQCRETQQPVPPLQLFQDISLCLEGSWSKDLQRALHETLPAVSQVWDVFPNLTEMELCLTMRKPNCLYFSVIPAKNMLEKIGSRRICHLYTNRNVF